jgi:peptide deformylase
MSETSTIKNIDLDELRVIHYPDPRLKEEATPIETVDDSVRALIARMKELMFESRGVGLAASQVGVTVRLFLASPMFDPDAVYVYINPKILSRDGTEPGEEGCLSFPGIYSKVKRAKTIVIEAQDQHGKVFRHEVSDLHARICQHENDHLDGILLVDRMGSVSKLSNRKALTELEEEFRSAKK